SAARGAQGIPRGRGCRAASTGGMMSNVSALRRGRTPHPFDDRPLLAIWELTQACDLACVHCRACASPGRDPRELTTDEGKRLLSAVAAMGTSLMVLTGGDPAKRPDLVELVEHGAKQDL